MSGHLDLRLVGRVRLVTADGVEVTPRGKYCQAMLALLGTAPGLRRTRAWLQDKLWSESPPERGSASLRQVLTRLRRELGDRDCLRTDGTWVGLDGQRVRAVLTPLPEDWEIDGEPPEFAAGLDIADPEFEDWLRNQRMAIADVVETQEPPSPVRALLAAEPQRSERPILMLAPPEAEGHDYRVLGSILLDEIGSLVASVADAEVMHEEAVCGEIPASTSLRMRARLFGSGDHAMVQLSLFDPRRGESVWTGRRTVWLPKALAREDGDLERLVSTAAAAATHELSKAGSQASDADRGALLGLKALSLFASYDSRRLDEADRLFDEAWQRNPAPVFLAWRSYVAFTALLERVADDPDGCRARAVDLGRQALVLDPFNPVTSALTSDVVSVLEGQPDEAVEMAARAVAHSPASPYARASLAYRHSWYADPGAAYDESLRARALAAGHFNLTWWDMRCFIAATRAGRYDEAIRFAEAAHRRAPSYRPPLRFMAALKYARRDEEGALKALEALRRLEPDFTLDLFASDSYPVNSLRGSPLMEIARSGLM